MSRLEVTFHYKLIIAQARNGLLRHSSSDVRERKGLVAKIINFVEQLRSGRSAGTTNLRWQVVESKINFNIKV
jgi:hypothetical protein